MTIADQTHALGQRLSRYTGRRDAAVVGLAGAGICTARCIAAQLSLPFLSLVLRKLQARGVGFGFVSNLAPVICDHRLTTKLGLSNFASDLILERERRQLHRDLTLSEHAVDADDIHDRVLLLVLDPPPGRTGLHQVLILLRRSGAAAVVLAAPRLDAGFAVIAEQFDDAVFLTSADDSTAADSWRMSGAPGA